MTFRLPLGFLFLFALLCCGCGGDDDEDMTTPTFTRADYVGTYDINDNCDGRSRTFVISLRAGNASNTVLFDNMLDIGEEVGATVAGDQLTIPRQRTDSFRVFEGSGTLTTAALRINYTVSGASCFATLTPR